MSEGLNPQQYSSSIEAGMLLQLWHVMRVVQGWFGGKHQSVNSASNCQGFCRFVTLLWCAGVRVSKCVAPCSTLLAQGGDMWFCSFREDVPIVLQVFYCSVLRPRDEKRDHTEVHLVADEAGVWLLRVWRNGNDSNCL